MRQRLTVFVIAALAFAVIAAGLVVRSRFTQDLATASERATRGATVIQTRCGPIEYEEAGAGSPLLMVHGSGGGHDQAMDFARAFAQQGIRIIAPSRFGYLGTPLPADASPEAQADAHACLLDALRISRAGVLGASAGALSALQTAIRHPDRVASLILVVPITPRPFDAGAVGAGVAGARSDSEAPAESAAAAAAAAESAPAPAPASLAERVLLWLIGSDFVYWSAIHVARDPVIQRVLATPPEVVHAASPAERMRVHAMVQRILPVSARAAGLRNETAVIGRLRPYDLAAIRSPTLLISVRDDGYGTYANAEYTAARIAGAKFIGFEQGGHLWVGHDDEVRRAVLGHVIANARP